jgi:hypothetical protein
VARLFTVAQSLVEREPGTVAWFAIRLVDDLAHQLP